MDTAYIEIPKVTGRHRNSALAAERRRRCVELVLSGYTYQEVADELGYANRGTVHRIVRQALDRNEAESIDELRDLELNRLDAMQAALWEQACAGDLKATALVLKILGHRAKLLGLFHPAPGAHSVPEQDAEEVIILW